MALRNVEELSISLKYTRKQLLSLTQYATEADAITDRNEACKEHITIHSIVAVKGNYMRTQRYFILPCQGSQV